MLGCNIQRVEMPRLREKLSGSPICLKGSQSGIERDKALEQIFCETKMVTIAPNHGRRSSVTTFHRQDDFIEKEALCTRQTRARIASHQQHP
jgi:hypothetical protein